MATYSATLTHKGVTKNNLEESMGGSGDNKCVNRSIKIFRAGSALISAPDITSQLGELRPASRSLTSIQIIWRRTGLTLKRRLKTFVYFPCACFTCVDFGTRNHFAAWRTETGIDKLEFNTDYLAMHGLDPEAAPENIYLNSLEN